MITSTNRRAGPYAADGSNRSFPFGFKVFSATDVKVVVSIAGVETVLTTGFSVLLNSNQDVSPGGSVIFDGAPAAGTAVALTSQVALTQPMQLTNNGGFFPRVLNDSADRGVILAQQLSEQIGRAALTPITEPGGGFTLPGQAIRANKVLGFDGYGNPIAVDSSSGNFQSQRIYIGTGIGTTDALGRIALVFPPTEVSFATIPVVVVSAGDGGAETISVLNATVSRTGFTVQIGSGGVALGAGYLRRINYVAAGH